MQIRPPLPTRSVWYQYEGQLRVRLEEADAFVAPIPQIDVDDFEDPDPASARVQTLGQVGTSCCRSFTIVPTFSGTLTNKRSRNGPYY
jgi:hypothetical protein